MPGRDEPIEVRARRYRRERDEARALARLWRKAARQAKAEWLNARRFIDEQDAVIQRLRVWETRAEVARAEVEMLRREALTAQSELATLEAELSFEIDRRKREDLDRA